MTLTEYNTKRAMLETSDAPHDLRKEAIEELDAKFLGTASSKIAMQQIVESAADISDIEGHN